jgi:hypothetical protein
MKRFLWSSLGAVLLIGLLGACGTEQAQKEPSAPRDQLQADRQLGQRGEIIPFDAPFAGNGEGQGTYATSINPWGVIVGSSIDGDNVWHAFLRDPLGNFTTYEAPGAGTGSSGTSAFSINAAGAITGDYVDGRSGVQYGYVRDRDGKFTTFRVHGAQATGPTNINLAGIVAGTYYMKYPGDVGSSFLRAPNGKLTTFDVPNADQGTYICGFSCLNREGAVTGNYLDAGTVSHGFVRAPDGRIMIFDVPGSGTGPYQGTYPSSINLAGTVTGTYVDENYVGHGFVRSRQGSMSKFDVPGADWGTYPSAINAFGEIVGAYYVGGLVGHGFVRAPGGSISTFDVPGAGTGANQGTFPYMNSAVGAITGIWIDGSNASHGFLRKP